MESTLTRCTDSASDANHKEDAGLQLHQSPEVLPKLSVLKQAESTETKSCGHNLPALEAFDKSLKKTSDAILTGEVDRLTNVPDGPVNIPEVDDDDHEESQQFDRRAVASTWTGSEHPNLPVFKFNPEHQTPAMPDISSHQLRTSAVVSPLAGSSLDNILSGKASGPDAPTAIPNLDIFKPGVQTVGGGNAGDRARKRLLKLEDKIKDSVSQPQSPKLAASPGDKNRTRIKKQLQNPGHRKTRRKNRFASTIKDTDYPAAVTVKVERQSPAD